TEQRFEVKRPEVDLDRIDCGHHCQSLRTRSGEPQNCGGEDHRAGQAGDKDRTPKRRAQNDLALPGLVGGDTPCSGPGRYVRHGFARTSAPITLSTGALPRPRLTGKLTPTGVVPVVLRTHAAPLESFAAAR